MKIAITHLALTTESGDPRMVFLMARELKKAGHAVVVYTAEFDRERSFPNLNNGVDVRVVPPPRPLASARGAVGILQKVIQRIQGIRLAEAATRNLAKALDDDLDVIICENDYTYELGALYKQRHPKTRVIWIMNNPPFFHSRKSSLIAELLSRCVARFELWRARRYASGIDWAVVFDEGSKKVASAIGRPVKAIPNPIDVDRFFAPVHDKLDPKGPVQLLSVGALTPQRRFEDTVTAVALLRTKGYDARALIICKDFYGDTAYRKAFEAYIANSGVAQWVTALFEGAPDDRYLAAIRESHIFVHPNDVRIWGVGAFEAMAAGLPLIVSRVTAVADVLREGESALLVDAHRPEDIAARAEWLLRDGELRKRIASAGQKLVVRGMSIASYAGSLLRLAQSA